MSGLLKWGIRRLGALVLCSWVGAVQVSAAPGLSNHGQMPALDGAVAWLNSPALDRAALKGKVVLVDFWTFDCINCQRSLPYVNTWAKRYAEQGLVVIGVHTPEYDFEHSISAVREQVARLGIGYPVAIDNDYRIWKAFDNQYWPAHYIVDAQGDVRYAHFGEGKYDEQEQVIKTLLQQASTTPRQGSAQQ